MTRALALLTCAACLLLPLAAAAKPKIALTQIEGDASGDVRDAVAEALEGGKELSLIASREVNRAVDKLGDLSDLTEKDFKKLATELEADAIVAGKLDKVGSAKTLRFRLFVHKKMAKGFTVSFKDAKSEKFRTLLHDKMLDKIGIASGGGGGADADDDDAKPAKKAKAAAADDDDALATKKDKKAKKPAAAADDDDAKPAKKSKAAKADAKADADDDDAKPAKKAKASDDAKPSDDDAPAKHASGDDDDAPRKAKKKVASSDDGDELEATATATAAPSVRPANSAAIRFDLGASVQQHSFKFNSNNKDLPKNITLPPVPGARFDGEFYPLLLNGSTGALANLGLGFEYDRTLSLNLSTNNPNNMMTYTLPVKQSHYSVGLRYRLAFGKTETSPTLTLGVGYGKRLFSPNRANVANDMVADLNIRRDTPASDFTIIDPSLMFRLPVTRMVAFSIGGEGMLITSSGAIGEPGSYGRAKVYGAEAIAAVDVVLSSHFALRFAGEFVQIGFTFTGVGALTDLDNDPTTHEVGGLADRSLGGSATLSILY